MESAVRVAGMAVNGRLSAERLAEIQGLVITADWLGDEVDDLLRHIKVLETALIQIRDMPPYDYGDPNHCDFCGLAREYGHSIDCPREIARTVTSSPSEMDG